MAIFPSAKLASRVALRLPLRASVSKFSIVAINGDSHSPQYKQLILYTKPGCCLCDGLKEKLQSAICLEGPKSLHSVQLQVRDITGNAEWEMLYQYEIPVLARVLPDGREETLPRLSPRLGVELIQKKIAAAFEL